MEGGGTGSAIFLLFFHRDGSGCGLIPPPEVYQEGMLFHWQIWKPVSLVFFIILGQVDLYPYYLRVFGGN